jgi:hypothetical protein
MTDSVGVLGFAGDVVVFDVATLEVAALDAAAFAAATPGSALLAAVDRAPAFVRPLTEDPALGETDGAFARCPVGVASSAITARGTHSTRPATIRAVHEFDRWSDIDMRVRAYAQG